MKLLIESAIVFFGTLLAAALLALARPAGAEPATAQEPPPVRKAAAQVLASTQPRTTQSATGPRPVR
jgi:hypothetical protein